MEILVTLKIRTAREPEQVERFLLASAEKAGDVREARFRVLHEDKRTNADKVRGYLRTVDHTGATQAEISRAIGINPSAVSKAIKKLRHQVVRKPGRRFYIPQ